MRLVLVLALLPLVACAGPAPTAPPTASAPRTAPVTATTTPAADVCHVGGQVLCALNPAVTDENVKQTICNPAWTKGLRPPVSLTDRWKQQILTAYHLPGTIQDYEGDHRMPEADLGGDPGARQINGQWMMTDQTMTLPSGAKVPANFADESPPSPNAKDRDETGLHKLVCDGKLSLITARMTLIHDWLGPYPAYVK